MNKAFNIKLKTMMNLLSIPNVRLAKAINVDSSLISRFKSGQRIPNEESELFDALCRYLARNILQQGISKEQLNLIGLSTPLDKNNELGNTQLLKDWFASNMSLPSSLINDFLKSIDSYKLAPEEIPSLPQKLVFEPASFYKGIEGMQEAVLRFLDMVNRHDEKLNIFLYSDQPLKWLYQNMEFNNLWKTLMISCLLKGHQITIIHHLKRNLEEMLFGISKWLPLYMTSQIRGYFLKHSLDHQPFSHTYFIAPGLAAIHSSFIVGSEDDAYYLFFDEGDKIAYIESQFNYLFSHSDPLLEVYNSLSYKEFNLNMNEKAFCQGDTINVLNAPSLYTMETHLLEAILLKNNIENDSKKELLAIHKQGRQRMLEELKNNQIIDYVYLPNKNTFASSSLKLNFKDFFYHEDIYYTQDDYIEHLKHTHTLEKNRNYKINALCNMPYDNIQISTKINTYALYYKMAFPATAFMFTNPIMCKATEEYIDSLCKARTTSLESIIESFKTK